jgi:hypothetical protein
LKAFRTGDIARHLWHPLSIEASGQFEELQLLMDEIQTGTHTNDKWGYI